jgi:hypothetical protein
MRRLGFQRFVIAFAVSLFVVGPVAACICIDGPMAMADMPCCPDGPMDGSDFDTPGPFFTDVACDFVPGNPIPASPTDLPAALVGASHFPAPVNARAPPPVLAPPERYSDSSPPIYLITLRIRD